MSPIDLAPPAIVAPAPRLWRPAAPYVVRATERDLEAVKAMPFLCAMAGGATLGAQLWTPAKISPAAWYDAELSAKTLSGTEVSQWNDLSGNSRHLTQGTSANRPTYSSADKWVSFDGSNDFLTPSEALLSTGNTAWTVFAVYRITTMPTSDATRQTIYSQGTASYPSWHQSIFCIIGGFGGNYNKLCTGVYGYDPVGSTTLSTGVDYIMQWQYTGSALKGRLNGTDEINYSYSSQNVTSAGYKVGSYPTISTNYANGKLRTLLAFRSALSTSDTEKVEGYLAHLWSLAGSLPSGHPYKPSPPYQ